MKYSSSWRKPYRPLTASATATKTAAITHTGAGRPPEPGPGAGGTGQARRPASGGGAADAPAGLVGWPAGVTMLMLTDPEPRFQALRVRISSRRNVARPGQDAGRDGEGEPGAVRPCWSGRPGKARASCSRRW